MASGSSDLNRHRRSQHRNASGVGAHRRSARIHRVGAYKAECIADDSPFRIGPLRTVSDVEEVASAWVHWYNTARMLHRLGRIPPTEYEAKYYAAAVRDSAVMI